VLTAPELALAKSAEPLDGSLVAPGSLITYTLTLSNSGNGAAVGALVSDSVPAGITVTSVDNGGAFDATTGSVNWVVDLASGATASVAFTGQVDQNAASGQIIRNVGQVGSLQSNEVQHRVLIAGDLTVGKSVDKDSAEIGEVVTYTITVASVGDEMQSGVVVTDLVPAGATYVDGSASCDAPCTAGFDIAGGAVVWQIGDLAVGATETMTFQVTVDPTLQATILRNTAVAQAVGQAAIPSNEVRTVVTVVLGEVLIRPLPAPALPTTGSTTPYGAAIPIAVLMIVSGVAMTGCGRRPGALLSEPAEQ